MKLYEEVLRTVSGDPIMTVHCRHDENGQTKVFVTESAGTPIPLDALEFSGVTPMFAEMLGAALVKAARAGKQ